MAARDDLKVLENIVKGLTDEQKKALFVLFACTGKFNLEDFETFLREGFRSVDDFWTSFLRNVIRLMRKTDLGKENEKKTFMAVAEVFITYFLNHAGVFKKSSWKGWGMSTLYSVATLGGDLKGDAGERLRVLLSDKKIGETQAGLGIGTNGWGRTEGVKNYGNQYSGLTAEQMVNLTKLRDVPGAGKYLNAFIEAKHEQTGIAVDDLVSFMFLKFVKPERRMGLLTQLLDVFVE